MADKTFPLGDGATAQKFMDMGDGTHAPIIIAALGRPTVARQIAAGASSASQALTVTCARVSIFARGADIRYEFGTGGGITANAATSHFIGAGERLDLWVPTAATFAAIRASNATADGALEISELQ